MFGAVSTTTIPKLCMSCKTCNNHNRNYYSNNALSFSKTMTSTSLISPNFHHQISNVGPTNFSLKAAAASSSSGIANHAEEPTTNVKFQTSVSLPGCSSALSLLGTGHREKVFAFIGVKVYAAGFYVSSTILNSLTAFKGHSAAEIQENSSLFNSIFQASSEKSLKIVLVRDVDGKTFWDALDEAISPRIKTPTPSDEYAISKFRETFKDRNLKKGMSVFLTWLEPGKMLVSVSSSEAPSGVDATIDSKSVTFALFDVFFGDSPVSPSLKASVSNAIATKLNCML